MKLRIILSILIFPFYVLAQKTAKVEITFENSKYRVIEKPLFFKFNKQFDPTKSELEFLTEYVRDKSGELTQNSDRFTLEKINNAHYVINYVYDKPSMVYINQRPVLITPGDDVKLTYRVMVWNDQEFKDTVLAVGNNAINYTFSNFFTPRLIKGDRFPDLRTVKYQNDPVALYKDLISAYTFRKQYYNSFLQKYHYNKEMFAYLTRANHIQFLLQGLQLEKEIAKGYKNHWPVFRDMLHKAFVTTKFDPKDTDYSDRMEQTIYAFFTNVAQLQYKNVLSKQSFDSIYEFIAKYPDSFVKEYFLFFLVSEYNGSWKKFRTKSMLSAIKNVKNPEILKAIARYTI